MRGLTFDPYLIDPTGLTDARLAYRALADAARSYLQKMDEAVSLGQLSPCVALHTRVRGTGPGVSFGALVNAVEFGLSLRWECPFEGSQNVSGAALPANETLGEDRDDGFLFLRFAPGTLDLPLHIHPTSDRFIYVTGGRGFFHVTNNPAHGGNEPGIRHVPARDRDAFMFRRGTVHTFSTAEHPLMLLSYHRPFVPLDDAAQYELTSPVRYPREFLRGVRSLVSFDAAWTCCA